MNASAADEAPSCPVCGDVRVAPLLRSHGVAFLRCKGCTHQFADLALGITRDSAVAHVERVYGDDYFDGGGAGYPDYLAEGELIRRHGLRYARVLERLIGLAAGAQAQRRVLDVGSAAGFILQGLIDGGWQGVGIEPNASMAAHARNRLGLDVRAATLESIDASRDGITALGGHFDLVSMVQVVAHFHDLERAFANAARLTAPDGHWLIETWDNASRTARLFGAGWHEYSPPSVLQVFSRESLRFLCARHGFSPVASGRPKKYLSGAHLRSVLAYKAGDTGSGSGGVARKSLLAALGFIPPGMAVRYPAEDLFWGVFRRR